MVTPAWTPPLERRTVRLATAKGVVEREGACCGGLAITPTRALNTATGRYRSFYRVTHLITGGVVGWEYGFKSEEQALVVLGCLLALPIDWRGTVEPDDLPAGFFGFLDAAVTVAGGFVITHPLDDFEPDAARAN